MTADFTAAAAEYTERTESRLNEYMLLFGSCGQRRVAEAMRYSLSAGGKRIRPLMTLEFAKMCGGDADKALSAACAVEMIHTYSLIHDDLPCMDNDDLRRGKPSCHIAYGEDIALLAGDGLLTAAFGIIASDNALTAQQRTDMIAELSHCAGVNGMIGGQETDIDISRIPDIGTLTAMYSMKTGALFSAACKMGCIAADGTTAQLEAAEKYAHAVGLAFQIIDDILDVTSSADELGKPVRSDEKNNKITYCSLEGIEKSRAAAEKYTNAAIDALSAFESHGLMKDFTKQLSVRLK